MNEDHEKQEMHTIHKIALSKVRIALLCLKNGTNCIIFQRYNLSFGLKELGDDIITR